MKTFRQTIQEISANDLSENHLKQLVDDMHRSSTTIDVLSEIDFSNKAAFQAYNAKHKMRPTTVVHISGKETTAKDADPDAFKDDDDEKDKKEPKSKEDSPKKNAVNGDPKEGDNKVKNNTLEHGFDGLEDATGTKPAPGNPGSAFNEIVSGEGVHLLEKNPDMSEQELAQQMFDQFGSSGLGQEQTQASGIKKDEYPPEINENLDSAKKNVKDYLKTKGNGKSKEELAKDKKYQKLLEERKKAEKDKAVMSKCIISARSSKQKHANSTTRTKSLQEQGKLGKKTKTHTFYGADDSKKAQIDIIEESKKKGSKVLLPNGAEVSHEDAKAFVDAGGGGANPADTGTFVTDEKGNVLVQFHSDKMSTSDIQDNSTLAKEGDNYKGHIKQAGLSTEESKKANAIVDKHSKEMAALEDNYNDQATPISKKLEELDTNEQVDIIEKDKGTIKKNLKKASGGGVKSQYKKYMPDGKEKFEELSTKEQYEIVRQIVSSGEGKGNDTKIINKVAEAVVKKNPDQEGLDVKGNLASQRKRVVDLQRKRVDELNKTKVKVDGVEKGLGEMMEADESIRSLHLGLMDDHEYDADAPDQNNRFKGIMNSAFDVNMGGTVVTGEVLKKCIGVKNTTEMKQKFELRAPEGKTKYTYDGNDNITGKKVYVYSVDDKGNKIEIGYKTYRSKQGADGKTQNTMQYSKHMQNCFERGQKKEQIEKGKLLEFNEWIS